MLFRRNGDGRTFRLRGNAIQLPRTGGGPVLWLFAGLAVLLALLVAHFEISQGRLDSSPWRARRLALLTLVDGAVVTGALVWQLRIAPDGAGLPGQRDWLWLHIALAGLTAVTVLAVAYQWTTSWFRGFVLVTLLLWLGLVATIGAASVERQELAGTRAQASQLDSDLAATDLTKPARAAEEALRLVGATEKVDVSAVLRESGSHIDAVSQGQSTSVPELTLDTDKADVRAAIRQLQSALDDLGEAQKAAEEAQQSVMAACDTAGGSLGSIPRYVEADVCAVSAAAPVQPLAQLSAWRDDLAQARLDVLELGAAVTATPTAEQQAAIARAREQLAASGTDRAEGRVDAVSLADALAAGMQASLDTMSEGRDWELPTWGWVLLAVAVVASYRGLEVVNSGLGPGPIRLAEDPKIDEKIRSPLRHHLLTNLPEPGAQPGVIADQSVTDLLTTDAFSKTAAAVGKVLGVLGFPARGWEVTGTVIERAKEEGDHEADSDPVQVTLVLKSARTGKTDHVVTAEGAKLDDAVAFAAYETASWVLGQARCVPPWMQWSPEAGRAYLAGQVPWSGVTADPSVGG